MRAIKVMVAWYDGLIRGWWYYSFGVFPLCWYGLHIYVLRCELTVGSHMPLIAEFYFILSKGKGGEKRKRKDKKLCWKKKTASRKQKKKGNE